MEVSAIFTIKDLAQKTKIHKSTINRYIDIGVIEPARTDTENGYRYFNEETVCKLRLIKTLKQSPFRLRLQEMKSVFEKIDVRVLDDHLARSKRDLIDLLIANQLFQNL